MPSEEDSQAQVALNDHNCLQILLIISFTMLVGVLLKLVGAGRQMLTTTASLGGFLFLVCAGKTF